MEKQYDNLSKNITYTMLNKQVKSLFEKERDMIANMANFSALLYNSLSDVNWVGFYLHKGKELILGPFQGNPACVRIAMGNGVCGVSAKNKETVIVPDVHQFDGHIVCDAASQSEIVIPVIAKNRLIGVLDIDSPILNRFNQADKEGLEALVSLFVELTEFKI